MGSEDLSIEQLGDLLPAYEIEELLASGPVGAVCRGRQKSLDRPVTLKVLHSRYAEHGRFRRSFEREAKAMAGLQHPNLLAVHDFGEIDGHLYLASEYVHGKPLSRSLRSGPVHPEVAVGIMQGICRGLEYLHDHGVVHRDLKPSNVLLTPEAQPKIGDFGLAQAGGDDDEKREQARYHAPEQAEDPEAGDERCDLFAAGVILCEMLTGEPGTKGIRSGRLHALADRKLRDIVLHATHSSPNRRPKSARAMLNQLKHWGHRPAGREAGGKPAPAGNGTPRKEAQPSPAARAAERAAHAREAARFGRRLAIIVILLIAIAVMWKILDQRGKWAKEEQQKDRQEKEWWQNPGR